MSLVEIYQGLCDETRLRILNLLHEGELCVCHFQEVLGESQVKISKHLGSLGQRGLVEVEGWGNWMIYALPAKPSRELKKNLACLQDCAGENPIFQRDLARLKKLAPRLAATAPAGCACSTWGGAPRRRLLQAAFSHAFTWKTPPASDNVGKDARAPRQGCLRSYILPLTYTGY
jgi:ArsR family transcriptional regulator